MIRIDVFKKAWWLLDRNEKRNAILVFGVIVVSAVSSALMVGSVFPFLAVLAEPQRIHSVDALRFLYSGFGFQSDFGFLVALGIGALVVIVLVNVIQMVRTYVMSRFIQMRIHSLSHRLLELHLGQPYEFFLDRHSGVISKLILAESGQVVSKFLKPVAESVASLMTILAIVGLLLWVNIWITVLAFLALGGVYALTFFATKPVVYRLGQERVRENGKRFRLVNEVLGGIKDVKTLGREAAYAKLYHKPSWRMARTLVSLELISRLPQFLVQAVALGGIILICLLLMDRAGFESGNNSLGNALPVLGVFAFAGQRLIPELSRLYQAITQLQYGIAAVESVTADLDTLRAAEACPQQPPPPLGLNDALRLEGITYRYPASGSGGLSDLSLAVPKGQKIGIVGSTGAGKTTLVDIVLGLLLPQSGRLVADGVPITAENRRAWQQTVGYVPQDIFLIDASIAANIALGVPKGEIDFDRIVRAGKAAQIHAFVTQELADGYATEIGERGVRVSGGQRQRIGIARALYHDADLLVFDEATSALDNSTERDVMAAIRNLSGDKTILMIAHRLSTVRICDRIIVLDKGRMVASGSWDELVAESSHFHALLNAAERVA